MGQQSLLLVLLASFLLSLAVGGLTGTWSDSTRTVSTQFEEEQALNIANSGVNLAISKLRLTKTWRTGFSGLAINDGTCDLTVTNLGVDSVEITSIGSFGAAERTAIVRAKLSSIFPTAESALTIFGDSVEFSAAGKAFAIDGRDYKVDGATLGENPAVFGLAVNKTNITDYLKKQITDGDIADNIVGKGSNPSVGTFNKTNLDSLMTLYRNYATMSLPAGKYSGNATYGTMENPVILHVKGDLEWTGTINGAGILLVDGALRMAGKVSWKGIVMALNGSVDLDLGDSGTPSLLGTTFIGNKASLGITKVRVNGNPSLKYSYETLELILARLNLLQVEVVSYWE